MLDMRSKCNPEDNDLEFILQHISDVPAGRHSVDLEVSAIK